MLNEKYAIGELRKLQAPSVKDLEAENRGLKERLERLEELEEARKRPDGIMNRLLEDQEVQNILKRKLSEVANQST